MQVFVTKRWSGALLALGLANPALGAAADRFADVKVTSQPVSGSVHMLMGAGGNIAASVGADGTLIVDDQFAPLSGRIQQALNKLGGGRPKLVLNTHFHGDHTGGNSAFGEGGTIVAQANVRVRLLDGDGIPRQALPTVTFTDRAQVHFNDDDIDLIHLPNGHTDGDAAVWFRNANVIHLGDHLFNGSYPYIDVSSGGSIAGFVKNLSTVLDMVPSDIKVIPGHGALGDRETIRTARDLVRESTVLIMRETEAGTSDADIVAALNESYPSAGQGFINAERWLSIVRTSTPEG